MNTIEELLGILGSKTVPNGEINGISLEELSRSSLASVRHFLKTGKLDTAHAQVLQRSLANLRLVNPALTGENQVYFGLLYRVCELTSEQASQAAHS